MIPACFISDLHLFSPRSMAEPWRSALDAACRESQLIVLGGDVFDFRWANLGGHAATLGEAHRWLVQFISRYPQARFVYVLGNHDSHPDLQAVLDELACRHSQFVWRPDMHVIADCLFCHGDIIDAGGAQGLAEYRRKFQHHKQASRTAHRFYDLAVAMRLHRKIPELFHRPKATCEKLIEHLQLRSKQELAQVRRVFFGHTHVPVYELRVDSLEFFNPGAALKHLNFAPITFEIEAP